VPRGKGNIVALGCNYFSFVFAGALLGPWLLRGRKFDVIFVYGTSPILQAIPGVFLRWFKRARLVVWVQDLWPESLQAAGFIHNRFILGAVAGVLQDQLALETALALRMQYGEGVHLSTPIRLRLSDITIIVIVESNGLGGRKNGRVV